MPVLLSVTLGEQGTAKPQQVATQSHRIARRPQAQLAAAGAQSWPFPGQDGGRDTPGPIEPPPIKATFNGSLEKLVFFLNQVWAHLDQYGPGYFDDVACERHHGEPKRERQQNG